MKIFISHSHYDQLLGEAWKSLFHDVAPGIDVWYSSDSSPRGGMGLGQWRKKVSEKLNDADIVLAIFTPESRKKPWIIFESAYAMGMCGVQSEIIPILYFMNVDSLPSPLQDNNYYRGNNRNQVTELCSRLVLRYSHKEVKRKIIKIAIEDYMDKIKEHSRKRITDSLFHNSFHLKDGFLRKRSAS